MGEWKETTLGQFAKVQGGFAFKSADFTDSGVAVIKIKNVRPRYIDMTEADYVCHTVAESAGDYFLKNGDVVISMTGSGPNAPNSVVGRVALYTDDDGRYVINQRVGRFLVKDHNKLDKRFLFFLLSQKDVQDLLVSNSTGSANQANISNAQIESLRFLFPNLTEQRVIASVLGALDDKIELNQRMNATLEAMARAVFKDWFVDFGPTRAKAEGRAPYLAPDLWALFPDALDDDDKPVGWEFSTLAAVAALNPETWSRANAPEEIKYVDLANTKWGVIESTQRHAWAKAPSRAQRILRPGDTIVGTVRPGNGSYAFVGEDGLTGSTGFAVLRPIHAGFREFVYLAATSAENIERLSHLADGAAYPAVRPDVVTEAGVIVPPGKSVMDSFSSLVAPIVERCEANKRECLTLAQTRDLLLPKLMSGDIRLREAEKAVEAVA